MNLHSAMYMVSFFLKKTFFSNLKGESDGGLISSSSSNNK